MRSLLLRCLVGSAFVLGIDTLHAQARSAAGATPQYKGILESVSYTEDLNLNDVFFVNVDVGWIAGDAGTILRTIDGGKTWEAQLGGDPKGTDDAVRIIHFLDERRGWAVQGRKMLHTRDGEQWEEIGTLPPGVLDIEFTSPTHGVITGNPSQQVSGSNVLFRTTDGGRSWKPVFTCEAKVRLDGLNRNIDCVFGQIEFPSSQVGYAVAAHGCLLCSNGPALLAKTTDGGGSWQIVPGPGSVGDVVRGIFFLDERTGFVRLASRKLHMTTDGGATWRGIVASPGEEIQFADPSVGWAMELDRTDLRLSYTTDGGNRWNSREVKLPATIRSFSIPRRDRAYIVGENGMVFRYRVVPASHPMGADDIALPAMPGFGTALGEQIAQLEKVVGEMQASLGSPSSSGGVTPAGAEANVATADAAASASEPLNAPLPAASPFTAQCCKTSFNRLEVVLGALSQTLPEFIGKYRNLNLLLAAVRMSAELPKEFRAVKGGLGSFRTATDKESAQAALASVSAALSAIKQTAAVSMQQQLPPVPPDGGGDDAAAAATAASSDASQKTPAAEAQAAAQSAASAAKDSTKAMAKEVLKDAAKKGLGSLLRGKKP